MRNGPSYRKAGEGEVRSRVGGDVVPWRTPYRLVELAVVGLPLRPPGEGVVVFVPPEVGGAEEGTWLARRGASGEWSLVGLRHQEERASIA